MPFRCHDILKKTRAHADMADNAEGRYVWVSLGQRIALDNPGWWYNEKEGWLSEKEKAAKNEEEAKQLDFYTPDDTWNSQWHGTELWDDNDHWDNGYNTDAEKYKSQGTYQTYQTYKKSSAWGRKTRSRPGWSSGSKGPSKWEEWDYVEEEPYVPHGVNPPPPPAYPKPKAMPSSTTAQVVPPRDGLPLPLREAQVVPPRKLAQEAIIALQKVDKEKDDKEDETNENEPQDGRHEARYVKMFTGGQGPPPEPINPPMVRSKEDEVHAEPKEHFSHQSSGAIKSEPGEQPDQIKQKQVKEEVKETKVEDMPQPKQKNDHKKIPPAPAQKSVKSPTDGKNEGPKKVTNAKVKHEPDGPGLVKEEKKPTDKNDGKDKKDADKKDPQKLKEKEKKAKEKVKKEEDSNNAKDSKLRDKEHEKGGKSKKGDDILDDKAAEKKRKVDDMNERLALAHEKAKKNEAREDEMVRLRRTQVELQILMSQNNQRIAELNEKKKEPRPQAKARGASTTASGDSRCAKPSVPRPAA